MTAKEEIFDFLDEFIGADDWVDEGRTRRWETWDDKERRTYNTILRIIDDHFGYRDEVKNG